MAAVRARQPRPARRGWPRKRAYLVIGRGTPYPMQWTPDVDELPRPAAITEAAFAGDEFSADAFVDAHSRFQSLPDTLRAAEEWEQRFAAALQAVVNAEFAPTLAGVAPVAGATGYAAESQQGLRRFARSLDRVAENLARAHAALGAELRAHRALCVQEAAARRLACIFDLLGELEHALPSSGAGASALVLLAKSHVALRLLCAEMAGVRAVKLLMVSVGQLRQLLLEKLNAAIGGDAPDSRDGTARVELAASDKLALLEAREWVLAEELL